MLWHYVDYIMFIILTFLRVNKCFSTLPIPNISSFFSLKACCSFSSSPETKVLKSSKERQELTVMLDDFVDLGGTERDWNLYTDTKTNNRTTGQSDS